MKWECVANNWKEYSGQAKAYWDKLTEDDWASIEGRREQLEVLIQKRYGYSADRIREDVEFWLDQLKDE